MTTYRCTNPACTGATGVPLKRCPRCGKRTLEPVPPRLLARPATPASDQLAIPPEDLEDFDTWARRLNREGGQAQ